MLKAYIWVERELTSMLTNVSNTQAITTCRLYEMSMHMVLEIGNRKSVKPLLLFVV